MGDYAWLQASLTKMSINKTCKNFTWPTIMKQIPNGRWLQIKDGQLMDKNICNMWQSLGNVSVMKFKNVSTLTHGQHETIFFLLLQV